MADEQLGPDQLTMLYDRMRTYDPRLESGMQQPDYERAMQHARAHPYREPVSSIMPAEEAAMAGVNRLTPGVRGPHYAGTSAGSEFGPDAHPLANVQAVIGALAGEQGTGMNSDTLSRIPFGPNE